MRYYKNLFKRSGVTDMLSFTEKGMTVKIIVFLFTVFYFCVRLVEDVI